MVVHSLVGPANSCEVTAGMTLPPVATAPDLSTESIDLVSDKVTPLDFTTVHTVAQRAELLLNHLISCEAGLIRVESAQRRAVQAVELENHNRRLIPDSLSRIVQNIYLGTELKVMGTGRNQSSPAHYYRQTPRTATK